MAIRHITIPNPPQPADPIYRGNQLAFNRAVYDWMARVKQQLENNSILSQQPAGPIVIGTAFTTNTNLDGTGVLADCRNMLCTLAVTLQTKGLITPRSSQG